MCEVCYHELQHLAKRQTRSADPHTFAQAHTFAARPETYLGLK